MPLQMGGIETDRSQVVLWDIECPNQTKDADKRIAHLQAQGFILGETQEGEVKLDPPPVGKNLGVFRILSQNGDDRVVWDRTDPKQVKEAFKNFKKLMTKGYTAYATLRDGTKGHKITEFDPGLQEIILVPKTLPG